MKSLFYCIVFVFSLSAWAHDEGHGPRITDSAKQGGIVASVISTKDAAKGTKAILIYKAELVRTEDGSVRVYFYNKEMSPLNVTQFDPTAKGILEFKKNKKWNQTPFSLKQEDDAFIGKVPPLSTKPFNIDIHVKENGNDLMAAFNNLD
jgi:hypothetical protein